MPDELAQGRSNGGAVVNERPKVPPAGRVLGWIVVVVALAYGARLVWELLRPLVPLLVAIVAMGVVYFFITRGWKLIQKPRLGECPGQVSGY